MADPAMAHSASARLSIVQARILAILLVCGASTDARIQAEYRLRYPLPEQHATPQSLRSRRAELVAQGLVAFAGSCERTGFGRRTQKWEAR